jgi:hypothetical protein
VPHATTTWKLAASPGRLAHQLADVRDPRDKTSRECEPAPFRALPQTPDRTDFQHATQGAVIAALPSASGEFKIAISMSLILRHEDVPGTDLCPGIAVSRR